MTARLPSDDAIFSRTRKGQDAVFDDMAELAWAERRLLLLVNGYTSLKDLAPHLPNPDAATECVRALKDLQLIAEVS